MLTCTRSSFLTKLESPRKEASSIVLLIVTPLVGRMCRSRLSNCSTFSSEILVEWPACSRTANADLSVGRSVRHT